MVYGFAQGDAISDQHWHIRGLGADARGQT